MILVRNINNFHKKDLRPAVAIGNFDGMHCGHQALLSALYETAMAKQVPSMLLTFEPLPHEFFQRGIQRIMPLREKVRYFKNSPLNFLCCLPFNGALASLSAEAFISEILVKTLQASAIIVGEDFHFGKNRQGDATYLQHAAQEQKFELQVMKNVEYQGKKIGSSWLRQLLQQGAFQQYQAVCGRPFQLSGKVVMGLQLGRELGFPTANIKIKHLLDYPLSGVYAARVFVPQHATPYWAAMNVGTKPTLGGFIRQIEVHLLDFQGDLYHQSLILEPICKIRDEQKFPDLAALKQQIHSDILTIRNTLVKI
jgi:riboflavin kinase/FMN adenylyltransferase